MVYASKFKPIEAGTHGLTAAPISSSQRERKRETTTNAHDWVWLGRNKYININKFFRV